MLLVVLGDGMCVMLDQYEDTLHESTETCPDQDVINDRKLTFFFSLWTNYFQIGHFCQLFVIYRVLIRTCFYQFGHCFLVVDKELERVNCQ